MSAGMGARRALRVSMYRGCYLGSSRSRHAHGERLRGYQRKKGSLSYVMCKSYPPFPYQSDPTFQWKT